MIPPTLVRLLTFAFLVASTLRAAIQWREGFEAGAPGWTVEGPPWEIGKPTAANGPAAFAGTNVAGTVLAGNYGPTHDSRLITPAFTVPAASESPRFTYHYWYQIGYLDYGQLQIRVDGGGWTDVPGTRLTERGESWARQSINLRAYAGRSVQLAFRFVAKFENRAGDLGLGWYVDDVALETGPMSLASPEGFENGFGDWSVEGGVWQVGTPTAPRAPAAFAGRNVAGTTLTGNYGTLHDARLLTPEFSVPATEQAPRFSFHYWYSIGALDYGQLEIRIVGGEWQDVVGGRLTEAGESWARQSVDLRAFAGKTVQLAFRLVAKFENRAGDTALGWFIDQAGLESGPTTFAGSEGFEAGFGSWSVENGLWQIGTPKTGVGPAPFAGSAVAGTTLGDNYGTTHDSRLITPEISVPAATALPRFSYHYWYAIGGGDFAQLQIRTVGGEWQDVSGERLTGTGRIWARRSVDLRAYSGKTVQFSFHVVTRFENRIGDIAPGWFIDEARLESGPMTFSPPEGFESGFGHWSVEGGVWQIGAPAARGKPAAFAGANVAGTILAGNYPNNADARLVSPEFVVPAALRAPELNFQEWHAIQANDRGRVEISVAGGPWNLLGAAITGSSPKWTHSALDLSAYAGKPVRIAFRFTSDRFAGGAGWFLDDVQLGALEPNVLALGTPANGTLAMSGARALYTVEVPPGGHLRFTLDDADDRGANEIYVRRGVVPTTGEFDQRFTKTGADQTIFVPNAGAGQWFVLVVGASVPAGGSAYQIRADFSRGIALTSVSPTRVGNGFPAVLTLRGAGFDGSAQVDLRNGTSVLATATATAVEPDRIRADFTLTNVPPGNHELTVSEGGNRSSFPIEVVAGGLPRFEAKLIAPRSVGRHAPATLFVEYANMGEVAMPAPLLVLRGSDKALLTLDSALGARGLWAQTYPAGYAPVVQILGSGDTPGVLQPGERKRVPVYYSGLVRPWSMTETTTRFDLGVVDRANANAVDWTALKPQLRPSHLPDAAWEPIWQNFVAAAGATWGSYADMLVKNAVALGRIGVNESDVTHLLAFQFNQADGLGPVESVIVDPDCTVRQPGFDLTFSRVFPQTISRRNRLGPLGWGWSYNWDFSLQKSAAGDIAILGPGGTVRWFQPDSRGGFFGQKGERGKLLVRRTGGHELREPSGLTLGFRTDGKLEYIEDPDKNRITAVYSGAILTALAHSGGATLQFTYSGERLESLTDPSGRKTMFRFDGDQHLVSVTAPAGTETRYSYETNRDPARRHALAACTDPRGTETFTYDPQGRLSSIQRGVGGKVTFNYAAGGVVTASSDTQNHSTYAFDQHGLIGRFEDSLGSGISFLRDREVNLTRVTYADGSVSELSYDVRGNAIRTVDPLGHRIGMTYGTNGQRTTLTDPQGRTTRFDLSPAGRALAIIHPDGGHELFRRNPQGEIISMTNRRGQTLSLTRDAAGRITRKATAEGRTFDFTYDSNGELITVVDSLLGTTQCTRDARGLLTGIRYPDGSGFTFAYDGAGRRSSSTTHDGYVLRYSYDPAGRLARAEDGSGRKVIEYRYDAAGRLSREEKGNGASTTYEYDPTGQLRQLVNLAPNGSTLSRFEYSYDRNGNRSSVTTVAGRHEYIHDPSGQLSAVIHPDGHRAVFEYDAAGNRKTATSGGNTINYSVNHLDQYTAVGGTRYTHDADGNVTKATLASGSTTYEFDSENQLVRLATPNGVWQYTYDAFGNRVAVAHADQTTKLLIDPFGRGNMVAEYDDRGALLARYDYGLALAGRLSPTGGASYYDFDGSGNTSELTDAAGNPVNRYAYDPFGAPQEARESVANPFTFAGKFGVAAAGDGLLCMRLRYYQPALGRFISADPVPFAGGEVNLYTYVGNSPLLYADPSGLHKEIVTNDPWFVKNDYQAITIHGAQQETEFSARYGMTLKTGDIIYSKSLMDYATPFHERQHYQDFMKYGETLPYYLLEERAYRVGMHAAWARDEYLAAFNQWLGLVKYGIFVPPIVQTIQFWSDVLSTVDPNELVGPAGYGPPNYLHGDAPLAYRLNFENDRTATAPVQVVEITNPLPANLDLAAFELTSAGFGDVTLEIPPASQRFEHTTTVTYQNTTFDVLTEIDLDPSTRELRAKFSAVMPETGLPPPVEFGFLPPEDGTGRGTGHIGYLARAITPLPTGTEIRNTGSVTFDRLAGGPTYPTDLSDVHDPKSAPSPARQALVTIDADPPTSTIATLPEKSANESFNVMWSGSDKGAGVTSHDIYVRTDGGGWTLWLKRTVDKAGLWRGQYGHRYAFYSVATDGAGLSEAAPAASGRAQATIEVVRPVWKNGWAWGAVGALFGLLVLSAWRLRTRRLNTGA